MSNETSRGWRPARYTEGDEERIISLFNRVFENTRDLEHWEWLFRGNPIGRTEILLAEGTDPPKLAGHYAVVPLAFLVDGETIEGSLSLDTMTDPDYGGRGIFTGLARQLYQELGARGNAFTYGFPNENSVTGIFGRLQWLGSGRVPIVVKPLRIDALLRRFVRSESLARSMASVVPPKLVDTASRVVAGRGGSTRSWPDGVAGPYTVREVTRFDERYDAYWPRFAAAFRVSLLRDAAYLTWRYLSGPGTPYSAFEVVGGDGHLGGFALTRTIDRFEQKNGFILEFAPESPAAAAVLLEAALARLREDGATVASAFAPSHQPISHFLSRSGFFALPRKLYPKEIYLGVHPNNDRVDREVLGHIENWYLSWGDTDVV